MSSLIVTPVSAKAKEKDVTSSMSKNKSLKKLIIRLSIYCIGDSLGKSTKTITVKNNNKNRLSIAAYVRYHINQDYDYTKKELSNTVMDLFGKKVKKVQCSRYLMKNTYDFYDGDYIYAGGDFGNMQPKYTIEKVVKKGKIYTAMVSGKIHYSYENATKKKCKITLNIKKCSKSKFKFIATKIKYKNV